MTKFEWGLVAAVVGVGIVSQIPSHDGMEMEGEPVMPAMEGMSNGMEMVTLAITGMT